ncbi:MAG TPA: ABC transporter substrate-binding protein [Nocardioidaceae bacterium]|nr:ABC transporter substrate-binding protein [Nocardioidaceae bacterium]
MKRRKNRVLALGVMCTTVAMLTAGCLQGGDDEGGGGGGGGNSSVDGGTKDGDGVVEIIGAFGGAESDSFEKEIKAFEEENDIDIQYTGTQDFQTIISSKVRAGDTPDIGLFPQPGTLVDLGDDGEVAPIGDYLDQDALEETLIPGLLDAGTSEDGTAYGSPMRVAVKSLVFVPQKAYTGGGYSTEPATIQELEGIADKIKASGTAPWCIGYGSDAATGWVGTDWIEEFMLRMHGPEVYDQWVQHEIPFDDPQVQEAFDAYGKIVKTEGNVRGGARAVINTAFAEAANPMFENPPKCMLHRQGNFITGFFPDDVQANLDDSVDVFYFPAYEGGYDGKPVLGGGDLAAAFNPDDDETVKVMEYLTGEDFGKSWAADGGWLSPHTTFDTSLYPDEVTRSAGEIAANADVFRFDGSDLMPTEVGGGSFWTGMVEWTSGEKTTEEVTKEIEASWPS